MERRGNHFLSGSLRHLNWKDSLDLATQRWEWRKRWEKRSPTVEECALPRVGVGSSTQSMHEFTQEAAELLCNNGQLPSQTHPPFAGSPQQTLAGKGIKNRCQCETHNFYEYDCCIELLQSNILLESL